MLLKPYEIEINWIMESSTYFQVDRWSSVWVVLDNFMCGNMVLLIMIQIIRIIIIIISISFK